MSAYNKHGFNSQKYLVYRPPYPEKWFKFLHSYAGKVASAVDLGCGPGVATVEIAKFADHVTAVDFSDAMIGEAKKYNQRPNIRYHVGSDKTFTSLLPAGSVDLLTVAEAPNWLRDPEFFDSALQMLKPNGTLAIFSYSTDFHIKGYPDANDLILEYAFSPGQLGPYGDKGQALLRTYYKELMPLPSRFTDVRYHVTPANGDNSKEPLEVEHDLTEQDIINMLGTWPELHSWLLDHPEAPPGTDPHTQVEGRLDELGMKRDEKVKVAWDSVYILARRV